MRIDYSGNNPRQIFAVFGWRPLGWTFCPSNPCPECLSFGGWLVFKTVDDYRECPKCQGKRGITTPGTCRQTRRYTLRKVAHRVAA